MPGQDKSVEVCMVTDKEHIRPVLLLQDQLELASIVPARGNILLPLDRSAVDLEPGIANVRLGTHFTEREVVSEVSLKVNYDWPHQADFPLNTRCTVPTLVLQRCAVRR